VSCRELGHAVVQTWRRMPGENAKRRGKTAARLVYINSVPQEQRGNRPQAEG
jgi:hypothetical protein